VVVAVVFQEEEVEEVPEAVVDFAVNRTINIVVFLKEELFVNKTNFSKIMK
jgi:hypothetical protein